MQRTRGWLYQHEKPVPVSPEHPLKPRFKRRLINHDWSYQPRPAGLTQDNGGHWLPPGVIPADQHLARFAPTVEQVKLRRHRRRKAGL